MAENAAMGHIIIQVVAGVSVTVAFVGTTISMIYFLVSGKLSYHARSAAGQDESGVSQLAVLWDNLHWGTLPSVRQWEAQRESGGLPKRGKADRGSRGATVR